MRERPAWARRLWLWLTDGQYDPIMNISDERLSRTSPPQPRRPTVPDTVSARVEIDLNELAKTLVENLDGDRLAGFIYNLVGLRDDDAWENELIAELSEPYEVPALSSPPRQEGKK